MQSGLTDKLEQLKGSLPKIQDVLNAVDQGLIKEENPPLGDWLWQLRDAADQANDVMDEIEYNSVMAKMDGEKNKVITFLQRAVNKDPFTKKLNKAVEAMAKVSANVEVFYQLALNLAETQKEKAKSTISNRDTSPVLNVKTSVFGREKEKEDIIERLLNPVFKTNKVNFGVLPIIGAGGIGKTTLAQLVYNDQVVKDHFELRVWVCVSNNFDVTLLTKKMYQSAFNQREVSGTFADHQAASNQREVSGTFADHQPELEEKFKSCKFLVVFDDVWNDNDKGGWEKLVAPLKSGKSGSMILLTTRTKEVAILAGPNLMDPYYLKGLKEDEMWGLFVESAFGHEDPNNHKKLLQIGKEIVMKLEGSPLAAKTVGGTLGSEFNEKEWIHILQSKLWNLKQGPNDIMPTLRLTYQYLPSHLKPCFLFCSIFPKYHIFIKDDLIYMWLALGLVQHNSNGGTPEDTGSKYFKEMLNRSIFSQANPVGKANFCYPAYTYHSLTEEQFSGAYVMHGLMHDLSASVSQGECFQYDTKKSTQIPTTVRHLYVRVGDCCELTSNFNLKNIHTLILQFDDSNDYQEQVRILNKLLKGMRNLRLLTLLSLNLSEIPESVSDLLHLRYLSLSSIKLGIFPQSMSKLYLLETIVCANFGFTKQADVLVNLTKLRRIIAPESFVETIAGIGRLTSLQELHFRVTKEDGFKICELGNMTGLRQLTISNIDHVGNHNEAIESNLKNKVNLCDLCLQWENGEFDENVFEQLEPHSNLKKLRIRGYMGRRPPLWLQTQAISELVHLDIRDCNWENLPYLEGLPFLKYLDFHGMHALKQWIISVCTESSQVDTFPSLEVLSFTDSATLQRWCLQEQPNKWMQCLKELTIEGCPMLSVLPPLAISLKKLKLRRLGLVVLPDLWEDPTSESGSLSSLVKIEISECHSIISLDEGLLRSPDKFAALREIIITNCNGLTTLQEGYNKFISLERLDIRDCPKIKLSFVNLLYFPPTLKFFRINNYVEDIQADMAKKVRLHELSLQSAPTLQIEEAKLVVVDYPRENSDMELRYSRMRDYVGTWPPVWLNQTPSTLEYLCIDGEPASYHREYFNGVPVGMNALLSLFLRDRYPMRLFCAVVELAYPSDMEAPEHIYLATQHIKHMPCLKRLTIALCSKSCAMPPIPLTLKELKLYQLALKVLPYLYENKSSDSESLPSLVSMEVNNCPNLLSIAEGLLQKPQQFAALVKLTIRNCRNLTMLPHGGFYNFVSLKELVIESCRNIQGQSLEQECFLPSSLEVLCINSCGDLDATLTKALESVQSLISLDLFACKNITNLPPKEVFSKWKNLEKLKFSLCFALTSLESLRGLSSVKLLDIRCCPKLVSAITSPSATRKDEIEEIVEGGTIQTSNRPASTQPAPTDPCSSRNTEHKPLLSVDELNIDNPLLLSIEPIRSLSSVRKLTIADCSRMQSLPELPPINEEISLLNCSPELKRRCEESGEDWPKLSHIPKGIHIHCSNAKFALVPIHSSLIQRH